MASRAKLETKGGYPLKAVVGARGYHPTTLCNIRLGATSRLKNHMSQSTSPDTDTLVLPLPVKQDGEYIMITLKNL